MPKLGLTMEEGTITQWYVAPGELVTAGTPILAITTDKTDSDVEASATGHFHPIAEVGETRACGTLIGWFLDEGEAVPLSTASSPPGTGAAVPPAAAPVTPLPTDVGRGSGRRRLHASPNARRLATERGIELSSIAGTGPDGRIVSEDLDRVPTAPPGPGPNEVVLSRSGPPASIAARALADLLGIDLAAVAVDPRERRVTKEQVAGHVRELLAAQQGPAREERSLSPASQTPSSVLPFTGMRRTIARRMHDSLQSMAQLTLSMDADASAIVADRTRRKVLGPAPSYTDYVIAAAARSLVDHPVVNAQVTDDGIALLPDVHVGLAVALDDGLIVPVVRNTLGYELGALAAETTRLAKAARSGTLSFGEIEGATFSVSTLGMYGVDGFTPVINPPNVAILGVGRIRDDVRLDDHGSVVVQPTMTLSLTWDHRVLDGAPAAAFCRSICDRLADPDALA